MLWLRKVDEEAKAFTVTVHHSLISGWWLNPMAEQPAQTIPKTKKNKKQSYPFRKQKNGKTNKHFRQMGPDRV